MGDDGYLTDFCRDFCKDFPCERDVIRRRKNVADWKKCDEKVVRLNEKWQKRLAKLVNDSRRMAKDSDDNRTEINRLTKIINSYEDERILWEEKYGRCENDMYAYKKRLNEEKNKRKMIEDAKKTELELEAKLFDKETNDLREIAKKQKFRILELETDYSTKINVYENNLIELNEMKTKYKKLENELQEKRVNCSKAINNYQALEVEIHLLQKRLEEIPKLKKKIEELNNEKIRIRELSRGWKTELDKYKEETMNLHTELEDCEKRKVKYIFTGEHLGQVRKKLRACDKNLKLLTDKFNKDGHPVLNICDKKFNDKATEKLLQNVKCLYHDKARDVKIYKLGEVIKRLKRIIERKNKELRVAKDHIIRAEFSEARCKEEIKKFEGAFFDVSKEVLYANNLARMNAFKVKQTKAEAGLINTQLSVERTGRKMQELKTLKAQDENRLFHIEIKKSRFTIKKLEKDKKECSDLKDEYKRRILGIVKDLKFDGDFEAINQKKMAKLTQAVENLQNMVFKHEETINMAKRQEKLLIDHNRQLEEDLIEVKRNFKADLKKSHEEIARLKAERAFYQTDCKKYAYYRQMAYTYKNRLVVENRKNDVCGKKLRDLREKELVHGNKIHFDDKMLMDETCAGCQMRIEEIKKMTETSKSMVLQMTGLRTRIKDLEMAVQKKRVWR